MIMPLFLPPQGCSGAPPRIAASRCSHAAACSDGTSFQCMKLPRPKDPHGPHGPPPRTAALSPPTTPISPISMPALSIDRAWAQASRRPRIPTVSCPAGSTALYPRLPARDRLDNSAAWRLDQRDDPALLSQRRPWRRTCARCSITWCDPERADIMGYLVWAPSSRRSSRAPWANSGPCGAAGLVGLGIHRLPASACRRASRSPWRPVRSPRSPIRGACVPRLWAADQSYLRRLAPAIRGSRQTLSSRLFRPHHCRRWGRGGSTRYISGRRKRLAALMPHCRASIFRCRDHCCEVGDRAFRPACSRFCRSIVRRSP